MKGTLKRIFEQFFACVTAVSALTIVIAGKVTVEQKGKQMIDAAQYAMVSVENRSDRIELKAGDYVYYLDKSVIKKAVRLKKKISFTPFGELMKTAEDLFRAKGAISSEDGDNS